MYFYVSLYLLLGIAGENFADKWEKESHFCHYPVFFQPALMPKSICFYDPDWNL
jgi:hypothetical protein